MTKRRKKWVACDLEDQYFNDERKIARKERKSASDNDRSKFKKTDLDKVKKAEPPPEGLLRGRVIAILSQGIQVSHESELITCVLRGSLKKDKARIKNLVTVGDFVLFEMTSKGEGVISYVEERKSVLSRADHLHQRQEQLIASNVDQVLITVSVVNPELKPFLIDRYIIAAHKGSMEPVIVINKIDLLKDNPIEQEVYLELVDAWKDRDVPLIPVSTTTGEGLDALKAIMKDKASVFSGQSGVGKSSLINAVTKHALTTGDVVEKTKKGSHTTTRAELLPLDCGGWVIDTPGIKSFGVWDLKADEIEEYFTEIYDLKGTCKFPDCSHTHEIQCAVVKAVEEGTISGLRYESYLYLLESVKEEHRPR